MQRLTDNNGLTIGYLDESRGSDDRQRVLDANYRTVGYIDKHGTHDAQYRHLSNQAIPGLLLER
jgi:hypothetical protein